MRYPLLAVTAAALFALSACGSSSGDDATPSIGGPATAETESVVPAPEPSTAPAAPKSAVSESAAPESAAPAAPKGATAEQARSTVDDVAAYAPALEQTFRGKPYPTTLAGAVAVARQLTNLKLSRGNSFGSYRYDPSDVEFKLCVENTSGAYAIYDTSPMTTVESGKSGGCP
ncbi:MAG: hypothetical protein JWQ74_1844 [Marmoricola sp.]|nr:hypothetical protein [Marmoricola sp.]